MRKKFYTAIFALTGIMFTGCTGGIGKRYAYYEDGEKYSVGKVTVSAERIVGVEIDWWDGAIEVEQSADKELRIYEEYDFKDEGERMRYYVDHGVVKVQYCASGYRGRIDGEQKRLLLEIPQGLDLEIESQRADISVGVVELTAFSLENRFGDLTAERLSCQRMETETASGSVRIGELSAKSCSIESKTGEISLGITGTIDAELETERGNITLYPHGVCMQVDFQTRGGRLITERAYEKNGNIYTFSCSSEGDAQTPKRLCTIQTETVGGDLCIY